MIEHVPLFWRKGVRLRFPEDPNYVSESKPRVIRLPTIKGFRGSENGKH